MADQKGPRVAVAPTAIEDLVHELRAPLSAVLLAVSTLRRLNGDGAIHQQAQLLDVIELAGARMASMIEQVLVEGPTTSLVERGVRPPALVAPIIHAASEMTALFDSVTVVCDDGLRVEASRADALEAILVSLLSNAVHHGLPPISVIASGRDDSVEVTVCDGGPGIDATHIKTLFTRFDPHARNGNASHGLGLNIARTRARDAGGDVSYDDGQPGACFVVTLPAPSAPDQAASRV